MSAASTLSWIDGTSHHGMSLELVTAKISSASAIRRAVNGLPDSLYIGEATITSRATGGVFAVEAKRGEWERALTGG